MPVVQMFKATKDTRRFRANQKVWIMRRFENHIHIKFRWRGNGRYTKGTIDKFHSSVGEIKDIEVTGGFEQFIKSESIGGLAS